MRGMTSLPNSVGAATCGKQQGTLKHQRFTLVSYVYAWAQPRRHHVPLRNSYELRSAQAVQGATLFRDDDLLHLLVAGGEC